MRKLLNTLYITTPDSYLTRDRENLVVKVDNSEKFRIPIHNLEGVVCFGYGGASPSVMKLCSERNVGLSFLNEFGHFYGKIVGKTSGNVLLRREQYRMADDKALCLGIAKNYIIAKIINSRSILKRAIRDHKATVDENALEKAAAKLKNATKRIEAAKTSDELRGIEGDSARIYYSVFNELILVQKEEYHIEQRNRRPPTDKVNALLSFLYTILAHDVENALETVGLDPYVGFLHTDRPGRASLALDLMEELRAYLADRTVLTLINKKQLNSNGFMFKESGGILMDKETKKQVLAEWQKRKHEKIKHPFLNEKIEIGLIPYSQALLLARFVRGDLEGYPPFLVK